MENWGDVFSTGIKLLGQQTNIRELWKLVEPILKDVRQVAPEAMVLARRIIEAVAPDFLDEIEQEDDGLLMRLDTRWLQESLNKLGEKLPVDGIFGDATRDAVMRFQTKHGLEVDGWPYEETVPVIFRELDKLKKETKP